MIFTKNTIDLIKQSNIKIDHVENLNSLTIVVFKDASSVFIIFNEILTKYYYTKERLEVKLYVDPEVEYYAIVEYLDDEE